MGLFGKVHRWRQAKIAEAGHHAEQQAVARGSSPEEARKAGERAARRRRAWPWEADRVAPPTSHVATVTVAPSL
jgi:predicted NAD-dependent protein-ADP-ribosyltransferase YbiA (DUF1768 family)